MEEYEKALALAQATVNLDDKGVQTLAELLVVSRALIHAEAERVKLEERAERYEEALQRIKQWSEAYPLDIFTKPDYKAINKVLTANGIIPGQTIDAISADCMRHVVEGVGKIAIAALTQDKEKEENHG